MTLRGGAASAAVGVLLLAAGCSSDDGGSGGGTGGSAGGSGSSPCDLLSAPEVEKEVGNPVLDGQLQSKQCYWDGQTLGKLSVNLAVQVPPPSADEQCQAWYDLQSKADPPQDVHGYGKRAYFRYASGGTQSNSDFVVCQEARVVWLALDGDAPETKMRTASEALMTLVLSRL